MALAFGACVLLLDQSSVLLEEDPVAHFVILPNFEEDETILKILVALLQQRNTCAWYPLKILAALVRQRNTCELCQRWTVSWRQLATSFEDVMATCHPPRIAEEVDCASPNTQFAFRKLWKKCGVELYRSSPQQCVHGRRSAMLAHILASSVLH